MSFDIVQFVEMDIFVTLFFGVLLILYTIALIEVINEESEKIATYFIGEKFFTRVGDILSSYAKLSIFIFIAIYVTLVYYDMGTGPAAIISQIGTIEFLIMMRILLNPTWDHPFVKPKQNVPLLQMVKIFKERILSMFSSFISLFWMIIILFFISIMVSPSLYDESRFIPTGLDGLLIISILISYFISLISLTLITEWILLRWIPIDQTLKNT